MNKVLLSAIMSVFCFCCSPALAGEGMMVFKIDPKDVEVYIDGTFKGKADEVLTLNVAEGEHTVKIVKDGKSREKKYFVPSGGIVKVELALEGAEKKRETVIVHAYTGLFQLASRILFDKYVDFIDIYAEIRTEEREQLYENLEQRKETVMLAQYIRNKGFEDGIEKGIQKGEISILQLLLNQRFGQLPEWTRKKIEEANQKELELWAHRILRANTLQEVFE